MNDATRTILIALGVALILLVLVPLLFMMGMMMGGRMDGGNLWAMGGLVLLVLVVSSVLIVAGVGRRPWDRR